MNNINTDNISRCWSSIIIDEIISCSIENFFISPGMRNAPLIKALLSSKRAKIHNGIDERSQSYKALGYAKASQIPAVLVCTSGTAVANYLPAIIEAKKTNTPMIILSADRPFELIEGNANQTINQSDTLKNFIDKLLSLPTPSDQFNPNRLRSIISYNIQNAIHNSTIIHINVPLDEPLDSTKVAINTNFINQAQKDYGNDKPLIKFISDINNLKTYTRPILTIGELNVCEARELKKIIKDIKIPYFLDVTSNLKYSTGFEDNQIPTFDHPEVVQYFESNPPDVIFHIGGGLTGKHFYKLLEKTNPDTFFQERSVETFSTTNFNVNNILRINSASILAHLASSYKENYLEKENWYKFINSKTLLIEEYENLTTPMVSKHLIETSKNNSLFFIGNSTAIRSFDSYTALNINKDFEIYTNRGASGIEGLLSSAIGCAIAKKETVNLVLGDISLIHDFNAIFEILNHDIKLNIYVLNNHSGGIFDLLSISNEKDVSEIIQTPHSINFKNLIESQEITYLEIKNTKDLKAHNDKLTARINFIEITLSNTDNKNIYKILSTIKL